MFSWKGSGGASNTRRSTCEPMPAFPRRGLRLADTSMASTTPVGPIRALTGRRRTRPILTRCHQSRWQPNQGRNTLRERSGTVQTNRATSWCSIVETAISFFLCHQMIPLRLTMRQMRDRPAQSCLPVAPSFSVLSSTPSKHLPGECFFSAFLIFSLILGHIR